MNGSFAESAERLTVPSTEAVRGTFAAIDRTVEMVAADCRTVARTLSDLNDALGTISQGAGASQQWGGFGIIGLPIMGAIKAVKGIAGQYVKQQTGTPLATWTELVANSTAQVETYLSGLGTVTDLARRYSAAAGAEVDPRQAGQDEEVLRGVRWQTQAWKQVLGRVAQLGRLVDAILAADVGEEPEPPEQAAPARLAGFSGTVQRRIKEVQSRTTERSGDLRQWVLQPFVDLHDRVRQLPALTDKLANEVALLEILLELEIVELRVCQGEIPPAQARIVRLRVAASALLPELARRLAEARGRAADYATYLDRLDRARPAGEVTEAAYAVLAGEYRQGLQEVRAQLAALEGEADRWRRDGPALLRACGEWLTVELSVVAARRLAEQRQASDDRVDLLLRERDRLAEAGRLLAAL
ncbi:MAG TPA: hypothetical protein VH573_15615 [Mycobacteriales bacterium]|jgi:hypothetical protein